MKILVLSSYAPTLFYFREDMMARMLKGGHQVSAAAPDSGDEWAQRFEKRDIKYLEINVERTSTNPAKDVLAFFSILRAIEKEKPDKVFAYQAKTVVYGCIAAKVAGLSEVYVLMGGLGSVFRSESKRSLARAILKTEYKVAFSCCKKVFFQNNDDCKAVFDAGLINRDKVVMINGSGVNLDKFKPQPMPDKPVFLFVGRIIKDKGIIEYIEAAKIVKDKYPEVKIQIVGYFDSNPTAISQADIQGYIDDGTIEYLGRTDDVRPFLANCSVFVLPSYHEGTPKSVLEAMAIGRPIITTDAPGCRETVVNGVNGFLVPVKSSEHLAKKMMWMIENKSQSEAMGRESLRICREKYDVNKVNDVIMKTMEL